MYSPRRDGIRIYQRLTRKRALFIIFLLTVLVFLVGASATVGTAKISFGEVYLAIISRFLPSVECGRLARVVVWELRVPRILMAIICGVALATAGCTLQAVLRNPLVSSYTIGISPAAGFGAALAIILGAGFISTYPYMPVITNEYVIITNAFVFALIAAFIVYGLAEIKGATPETIILAGIAITYLFGAFTSILQYIGEAEAVQAVVFWLLGSFDRVTWKNLPFALTIFPAAALLFSMSWSLNALTMGDEVAANLGVNVKRTRVSCLILASFITAVVTCFVGTIGFISLVSPHLARMLIGNDNRFLLPSSALVGAVLLLASDTIARTIARFVLPIGAVTSFIGVPFFIYLLLKRRREFWR